MKICNQILVKFSNIHVKFNKNSFSISSVITSTYIHTYIQTDRQTDKGTDGEIKRAGKYGET